MTRTTCSLAELGTWLPVPERAWALGKRFDHAIAAYSLAYAEQSQRDFQLFLTALATGRLAAPAAR